MFKLTFNKPAYRNFFAGAAVKGIRFKIQNGDVLFQSSDSLDFDVSPIKERERGGAELFIEGQQADDLLNALHNDAGPFFTLEKMNKDWVVARPYPSPNAPAKFDPHLRVWAPRSDEIQVDAESAPSASDVKAAERVLADYEKTKRPGRPPLHVAEAKRTLAIHEALKRGDSTIAPKAKKPTKTEEKPQPAPSNRVAASARQPEPVGASAFLKKDEPKPFKEARASKATGRTEKESSPAQDLVEAVLPTSMLNAALSGHNLEELLPEVVKSVSVGIQLLNAIMTGQIQFHKNPTGSEPERKQRKPRTETVNDETPAAEAKVEARVAETAQAAVAETLDSSTSKIVMEALSAAPSRSRLHPDAVLIRQEDIRPRPLTAENSDDAVVVTSETAAPVVRAPITMHDISDEEVARASRALGVNAPTSFRAMEQPSSNFTKRPVRETRRIVEVVERPAKRRRLTMDVFKHG